jgi:hypothetical protein
VHKGISAIIVIAIGLLGIGGCGGDSSLSKAEYDQKLELVCNKGRSEREELLKEISQEYNGQNRNANAKEQAEEQAANILKLMAVYRGTTEEIDGIGLPEQSEEMAEELVKSREDAVAKVEADPGSAVANFAAIFAKPNKISEELDVASCSK